MMNIKGKKKRALLLASVLLASYFLWFTLRPVTIVAIHQMNNDSIVLVKNFPFSDKGKINWWFNNREMLKRRYDIPKPTSYGSFSINFWLFGKGYRQGDPDDDLCFAEMKTKENCIEKDHLFSVDQSKNFGITFAANNKNYKLKKNGKIVKFEY